MAVAKSETRRDEAPGRPSGDLYRRDLYSWSREQVSALREGRVADLDLENLAEEIQDVGSEQFAKLESAYRVILVHMLKWDHQPERRSRSWVNSIETQRLHVGFVMKDNPGLRSRRDEAIDRAFRTARLRASTEMKRDLSTLPSDNPYPLDDILNRPFEWPEA